MLELKESAMKRAKVNLTTIYVMVVLAFMSFGCSNNAEKLIKTHKPRVIVTSDGEIDDECSMVRFLMYANEWDIEGIVTSSSQYHWHGHNWAGDDWLDKYFEAYSKVYPNLVLHDTSYPTPDYLKSVSFLGNVEAEGEMDSITPGSQHIAKVLLDDSDDEPVWIQAWGGVNTISRALKTIQEEHPEKMEAVAKKIHFFFIWEQDSTYQSYIRPNWGKYNIPTIICDQFWAIAYQWNKVLPEDKRGYFESNWMKQNILENHGALCSLYKAHVPGSRGIARDSSFVDGDFRSEGDSPSFLYNINTGLRNMESPDFGGWGGRYTKVRENTWLDPIVDSSYVYPEGRYYTKTTWGRAYMHNVYPDRQDLMTEYFKPMARWADAFQNDFAARADWCVKPYDEANHPPIIKTNHSLDFSAKPGEKIQLSTKGTYDPDHDDLVYNWWYYKEPSDYKGEIYIEHKNSRDATLMVPMDASTGMKLHIICEVTDNGIPPLTRYQRIIVTTEQ